MVISGVGADLQPASPGPTVDPASADFQGSLKAAKAFSEGLSTVGPQGTRGQLGPSTIDGPIFGLGGAGFGDRGSQMNVGDTSGDGNAALRRAATGVKNDLSVGQDFKQASEGNCILLATIKGFSESSKGQDILNDSVTEDKDGNFDVTFRGDPEKTYHVSKEDAVGRKEDALKGDGGALVGTPNPKTGALVAAMDQRYKDAGYKDGVDGDVSAEKIQNTLSGDQGKYGELLGANSDKEEIKKYIEDKAPGRDNSLTFGGVSGQDGEWSAGANAKGKDTHIDPSNSNKEHKSSIDDLAKSIAAKVEPEDGTVGANHMFTMVAYDKEKGEATYINPLDSNKEHKISIDKLAEAAAGTDVNFLSTTFV